MVCLSYRSEFEVIRNFCVPQGIPDDVVLRWVGHSSLRVTDGYTHRSQDSLSAMVEKVGLSQIVPTPVIAVVGKSRKVA